MHNEADVELRLLRGAQNDLNRRAIRHTVYEPDLKALVRQVIATERDPHPVVEVVPMRRRICRTPERSRTNDRLIDRWSIR